MTGSTSIVHRGLAQTLLVPRSKCGSGATFLNVHTAGQAVTQADLVAERRLPVVVRVDKAWRNNMAFGVKRLFSFYSLFGDLGNSAIVNTDICYIVIKRFRVHDPAAKYDQVVICGLKQRCNHEKGQHKGACRDCFSERQTHQFLQGSTSILLNVYRYH